jgi:hypothetical protein
MFSHREAARFLLGASIPDIFFNMQTAQSQPNPNSIAPKII